MNPLNRITIPKKNRKYDFKTSKKGQRAGRGVLKNKAVKK